MKDHEFLLSKKGWSSIASTIAIIVLLSATINVLSKYRRRRIQGITNRRLQHLLKVQNKPLIILMKLQLIIWITIGVVDLTESAWMRIIPISNLQMIL